MAEDERHKPGEPSNDDLMAYSRGELAGADAQRVRAWLIENPEMERALALRFPEDDARPGDPGYLPDEEISKQWAVMEKKIRPAGRLVPFSPWNAFAAAAVVAVVFAGLFFNQRSQVRLITRPELVDVTQELNPADRRRGVETDIQTLDVSSPTTYCALKLSRPSRFGWYRIEIFDASDSAADVLWRSDLTPPRGNRLELKIHRSFFDPGVYRIRVTGVDERTTPELADEFLLRVPAQ